MGLVLPDQKRSVEVGVEVVAAFNEALNGFVLMRLDAVYNQARSGVSGIQTFIKVVARVEFTGFIDELTLDAQGGVVVDRRPFGHGGAGRAGREHRNRVDRALGKVAGAFTRGVDRIVAIDQLDRVGQVFVGRAVAADRVLPEGAFGFAAPGIGQDHRQGHLALAEVVALILAHFGGVGIVVDRIIDQLEGHAEVAAIAFQRALLLFRTFGHHGADLAGGGKQGGGFRADDVEVLFFAGVDLALGGELRDFAFRDVTNLLFYLLRISLYKTDAV